LPALPSQAELPDELMPPLAMAIGHLVITWASIEATLNLTIAVIYHDVGGKAIETDLPRNLSRKVKFLRACFNRVDPLKGYGNEARSLLDRISALAPIRHAVIHGYLSGFDPTSQRVTFTKLDTKPTIHEVDSEAFSLPELVEAGGKSLALASDFVIFMTRLSDAFVRS
jgi:hypothetical protein